ncbi:MAG: 1-phosphofructokinase family hexose kinase, partial [Myxococcota bacterium]
MKVVTVTLNPALDLTVRVDGFRAGEVNRGRELRWDAGGKGVNVASFLAEAGVAVTATGLLGDENPGRFEALFRERGIADAFVRVPGETRVGIKLVDEAAQVTTDVNLPGLVPAPAAVAELRARIAALTADHDVFVLSGSVPPGIAPAIYADLTREL